MSKVKVNSGLVALMIIASLFVGWQAMLLVTILLFAFFEVDEKVKSIAIKVITFYIGYTVISTAWNLIVDGIELIFDSIGTIVATINSYLDYAHEIDIDKLQSYVLTPVLNIVRIADDVVDFLLVFVKLGFVISLLTNKKQKDNVVSGKINGFVEKALNFVNNFEVPVQQMPQSSVQNAVQTNVVPQEQNVVQTNAVQQDQNNQTMNF